MKISLEWLHEYVETGLDAEQIAGILRDLGLPCEGIETIGDNAVIDVEVTSNRGDCLSYIGIARELAAVTGKELRLPKVDFVEMDKEARHTDWSRIDLTPGQLRYAVSDVTLLIPLMDRLEGMLAREGRTDLARECFRAIPTLSALDLQGFVNLFEH